MNILHLSSEYPPQKVYGLGRFVHDLSVEQARQNHEVHVVTNSLSGKDYETKNHGVFVHRVNFPPPPKPVDASTTVVQFNMQIVERAVPLVKKYKPDVVNTHDWLTFLAGRVINRTFGIPHVFTVHDTMVGKTFGKMSNPQKLGANIEKYGCKDANRVICCSEYMRKELLNIYEGKDNIRVIPCGVEEQTFAVNSDDFLLKNFRSLFAREDEVLVTYVGRLDQEKGLDILLNAIGTVLQKYSKVCFAIAGKGVMEESIQQWITKSGLHNKVKLAGYIEKQVLSHFYKVSDLHIMPSSYEPFGIVALEAMVNKAPIIVANSGGLDEIIDHNIDGLKFTSGNMDSLANKILKVLEDSILRDRLKEAGYKKVKENYNWKLISEKTTKVYEECVVNNSLVNELQGNEKKEISKTSKEKICLVVQTYEKDFHLLSENALAFEQLVKDGHKVVFLCYSGDKNLLLHWKNKVEIIEADPSVPREYKRLIYKCMSGYEKCLEYEWDWLIKIDADTLICGDIPSFIQKYREFDAIGFPSSFEPVLQAISIIGPPDIPANSLLKIGNQYMRGFFYCIRRSFIEKALPIAQKIAPRDKMEDATFTAILSFLGAKIYFDTNINYYNSFEETQINFNSPVIHVESKNAEERYYFAKRANALFKVSIEDSCREYDLKLSLVIHVRNRKNFLLRMLETVKAAWVEERIELIIVDYGGDDLLAEDMSKLRWEGLRYIYVNISKTFSTAHARNIAFKAARGEWIVALDCDLLIPDNFISKVLHEYKKDKNRSLYGPVYKLMPQIQKKLEEGDLHPVKNFSELLDSAFSNRIDPPAGSIFIVPRENIFEQKGYDENYVGYGFQDIDLIERLRKSGLKQTFSEEIYAVHQFHGYPKNYNTSQIEKKNRDYFLKHINNTERNALSWGELPYQQKENLQDISWLESSANKQLVESNQPQEKKNELIVWCEGLNAKYIDKITVALKVIPYSHGLSIRLIGSNANHEQIFGFVYEKHSLAQVVTQVPRAISTIIPHQSFTSRDLKASCDFLKAAHLEIDLDLPELEIRNLILKEICDKQRKLKILVGMDEGIGNMVMLTPTLRALKKLFNDSEVDVIGREPALQVLKGWDVVANTISERQTLQSFYDLLIVSGWQQSLPKRLQGISFRYPPITSEKINLQSHESKQHLELAKQLGFIGEMPSVYCGYQKFSLEEDNIKVGLADASNSCALSVSKEF